MLETRKRGVFYQTPRFSDFPEEEYARRIETVRRHMSDNGIDILALWDEHNIRYFSGFQSEFWELKSIQPGVLVLPLDHAPVIIVPEFLRGLAEATTHIEDIRGQKRSHHIVSLRELPREVAHVITGLGYGKKRIGLEYGTTGGMHIPRPLCDIDLFRTELREATFLPSAETIWDCRMIKSALEIEALKRACALTTEAFGEFVESFSLGMSEKEAAASLYSGIVRRGLSPAGVYFIGDPSRYPMIDSYASFEGVPMSRGSHVVVECFGSYKGYCGGVGRCLEIGGIARPKWEFIEAVEHGQDAALAAIRNGVKAQDVITAVEEALAKKGFKSTGFVGHGIGLTGHEPPQLTDLEATTISRGMVLAIEVWIYEIPGFTRGGRIGPRSNKRENLGQFGLEETVVVTNDGYEMLPTFPREIRVIPRQPEQLCAAGKHESSTKGKPSGRSSDPEKDESYGNRS